MKNGIQKILNTASYRKVQGKLQVYYDLDGKIIAYQFGMMNGDDIVGNILVGASVYEFDVLRASEVAPPSIPKPEEVQKALEEYGIEANLAYLKEPARLVYTRCRWSICT